MPLLSALTMVLIAGVFEWYARKVFSSSESQSLGCMIVYDPLIGTHARANCVCSQKIRESPLVEYRFNNRGHRAGFNLYPKPPGTYRIVVIGSSMAEGLRVPWPQTFGALLGPALSKKAGKKIEIYDEALEYGTPRHIDMQFREVLDAQPDMILWAVTKWDIENVDQIQPPPPSLGETVGRMKALFAKESLGRALADNWRHVSASLESRSAALFLLNYYLSSNPSEFLKRYLQGDGTEFLKSDPNQFWKLQLKQFDTFARNIEGKAHHAGVPLITAVIPPRAEALMISRNDRPAGYDPYRFGDDIRNAILRQGGIYIDLLRGFENMPSAQRDYYPIDGHPNAAGHALLTRLLAENLCRLV